MKKSVLVLVFSLMAGAAIFSVLCYIAISQAKARLEQELSQAKEHSGLLERQIRQDEELISSLSEEKRSLTDTLKEKENKISQLEVKNTQNQEQIFSLVKEIEDARKQRDKTMQDLAASREKLTDIETKMHSIPELKKVIRELKIQMHKGRQEVNPRIKPRADMSKEGENNLGYLVKNGSSTYKPRIKIEVTPAQ